MNEIRFSQSSNNHEPVQDNKASNNKASKKSSLKSFFYSAFKTIVVLALLYAGIVGSRYFIERYRNTEDKGYSAVFLVNSQVYFGKIVKNNRSEMVLNEVFYLQVNGGDAIDTNTKGFTLVKLGQELHGPKDELFINKDQVVFYEYLRDDSKIVESIRNQKQVNN